MDELVDLLRVGLAAGVEIVLPREPLDYQAALLRSLGATWRVEPVRVSAQELTTTRDCKVAGCTNDANSRYISGVYYGLCDEHIEARRRELSHEASTRSNQREQQKPRYGEGSRPEGSTTLATRTGGPAPTWTREAIVDAIKLYARETGRFPKSSDWQKQEDPRFPSYTMVRKHFDSWPEALGAAGCPLDVPTALVRVEPDGKITILDGPAPTNLPPRASKAEPDRQPEPEPAENGTPEREEAERTEPEPPTELRFARVAGVYDYRRPPTACPLCGLLVPATVNGRIAYHFPENPTDAYEPDPGSYCRGSNL
ncbi:MAG: procyclic acidic repetitive family protein, partial [Actinomycetota bacterium]|nr:procyclic acidic repetitive family protein [Actinomycetota bacterium]